MRLFRASDQARGCRFIFYFIHRQPRGRSIMYGNHFWLRVPQLAEAFEGRGANDDQRTWQVISELTAMPAELRQQSLAHVTKLGSVFATIAGSSQTIVS